MINATICKYLNQIKMYDFSTYLHCRRVANISVFIGQELTLSQPVLFSLQQAALLHDLGKINISRDILNSTEKLTDQGWEVIKQHPVKGADILRAEKSIGEDVISGIVAHHERWNGKGYPYHLAGVNIPLSGRIIAIADALDAMISSRPYRRKPLSIDEAISEIECQAGQQFDPYILGVVNIKNSNSAFWDLSIL